MNKKDCKIGMFVAIMQNVGYLSRNRKKIKRIGKIVGIHNNYVSLMIVETNFKKIDKIDLLDENISIIIKRNLYIESFRFPELHEINSEIQELNNETDGKTNHKE